MKLSQDKIKEYIDLYLSDMNDYEDDIQNYETIEEILNSFKTTQLENNNENAMNTLIEASNNSEHKEIFKDLYEYIEIAHQ